MLDGGVVILRARLIKPGHTLPTNIVVICWDSQTKLGWWETNDGARYEEGRTINWENEDHFLAFLAWVTPLSQWALDCDKDLILLEGL